MREEVGDAKVGAIVGIDKRCICFIPTGCASGYTATVVEYKRQRNGR